MNLIPFTEQIIKMYTIENKTTTEISKEIGCSQSGVERLLKRNNIEVDQGRFLRRFTDEQSLFITEMYKCGMTTTYIASKLGVTDHTIAKIVRKFGGDVRQAKHRSPVSNHRFFENIDTPEKAYYLGWMITDGSVVNQRRCDGRINEVSKTISIELAEYDKYIIDKFAILIGASMDKVKICERKDRTRTNMAYFRFISEEMSTDLAKYGVIPNKTYSAYLPKIRDDLYHHMMRGVFDGNGTITMSGIYPRIAMYGTQMLCTDFKNELIKKLGFNDNKVSKSTCFHVWFSGKDNLRKFYDYLYKDCGDLYLKRKKEKFEKCIF